MNGPSTPQEALARLIADRAFLVDTVLADNSEAVQAKYMAYYGGRAMSRDGLRNALVSIGNSDPDHMHFLLSVPWLGNAGSPVLRDTVALATEVARSGNNPFNWPPVGLADLVAIAATNKRVETNATDAVNAAKAAEQAAQDKAAAAHASQRRTRIAIGVALAALVVLGIVLYINRTR